MKMWTFVFLTLVLLCGCTGGGNKALLDEYNEVLGRVQELERVVDEDWSTLSADNLKEIHALTQDLYYDYNPMDLSPEQVSACEALKGRVKNLREQIVGKCSETVNGFEITAFNFSDQLIEGEQTYPIYLKKGETLDVIANSQQPFTMKISNVSSRTILKSFVSKTSVAYSMEVQNTAIYVVEVIPTKAQYLDLGIKYKITDMSRLDSPTEIRLEQVECAKGEFGAKGVPGLSMTKCFEEPRKFTLRGQLKAAFSGNSKGLIAVQVPAGATDILYSLRIDTSERNRSEDGKFHDNLTRSYTRIKFLGLPLYEKHSSNGLLNTLLDDNRPVREEDAYCNMYVFRNQAQAKQFQDGTKSASKLNYDVDFSTIGTQSCNGRIPTKGAKTIYLGFENERMRYTNYIWVEVEAVVPNTVYYRTKYSID
ncbi:MAG: hypothetical protein J6R79_01725 [Bacteroidaceae bacterium]|nr:hypothetical protein [Bacteroidaceae bacterium]